MINESLDYDVIYESDKTISAILLSLVGNKSKLFPFPMAHKKDI